MKKFEQVRDEINFNVFFYSYGPRCDMGVLCIYIDRQNCMKMTAVITEEVLAGIPLFSKNIFSSFDEYS